MPLCPHAARIAPVPPPGDACVACLEIGGTWVHLRQCLTCGVTLCCDSSPNRHMTAHGEASGHPIFAAVSPGEGWTWCRIDESMIRPVDGGWELYDPFVEAGVRYAGRHLAAGGSPDVDDDVVSGDGFPVGAWFGYVRDLRAAGTLLPRDAEAIEALPGWRW